MAKLETAHAPTLESLFVDAESLPSPPVTVLEVVRMADDPDVTLSQVARLIELDVALAVQILRMANSALYSPVSAITTIERALATLGLRTVRLLALSASLRMLIPDKADAFDPTEIRRRMVINGSLARKFAASMARMQQDEAFLAGLLTGLGPIVLAQQHGDLCHELVGEDGMWPGPETEIERLGYTTNDVTVSLIRQWGLPDALCAAIESRLDEPSSDDTGLGRCLRLSSLAERALCGPDRTEAHARFLQGAETELQMSPDETHQWLVDAEPLVADTADMMQFQFPQHQAFSELIVEATMNMQQLTLEANTAIVEGSRQLEALSIQNRQLQRDATTDSLTQLPNRGQFDEALAVRIAECPHPGADGRTLGLLIMDLDQFKDVNDTYGHTAGDEVLRMIGVELEQHTRGDDLPARYGGDEFVVLLPHTNADELALVAERLRTTISASPVELPDGDVVTITVTIGGALVGEDRNESGATLLARADRRLYEAKRDGRNRVLVG